MSSINCTLGSITQMSAWAVSLKKPKVRPINPTKIDSCCVMSNEANVKPIRMPRYLARSPINIFNATKFMISILSVRPPRTS